MCLHNPSDNLLYLGHMAYQFNYRVIDILLKLTVIRPHFAMHVFQVLCFMSAFVTFNLLDSDMTVLTRDIQCISKAVCP